MLSNSFHKSKMSITNGADVGDTIHKPKRKRVDAAVADECERFGCTSDAKETLAMHTTSVEKDEDGDPIIVHWNSLEVNQDIRILKGRVLLACNNNTAFNNLGEKTHVWMCKSIRRKKSRGQVEFIGRESYTFVPAHLQGTGDIRGINMWAEIPDAFNGPMLDRCLLSQKNPLVSYFATRHEERWRTHMRNVHNITDWNNDTFLLKLE